MKSPRTSCDQPTTKIASGRSARTASIVSGAFTSALSTMGAPTSSKEHWPERSGSIGPGSVTTPAISAPASRAASSVSRPIVSKLTQTVRMGADSTEAVLPRATERRGHRSTRRGRRRAPCSLLRTTRTRDRRSSRRRRGHRGRAQPAPPGRGGGGEGGGADDRRGGGGEDEQHQDPKDRPPPDGRQADDDPAGEAEPERDLLVAAREDVELACLVRPPAQEGLREEPRAAEGQRGTDRLRLHRLGAVAVVVREVRPDADPGGRHRPGASERPHREPQLH